MREGKYFQNITIWTLEEPKTFRALFWESSATPALVSACVCSGWKTPLIRCHVVLEAVTCQGSSRYLSVTTRLFNVCRWIGTVHLNTHICCWSMAWTTEGSAIEMTPIVKHNRIQRCFRSLRALGRDGQTSNLDNYQADETTRDKSYNKWNLCFQENQLFLYSSEHYKLLLEVNKE